MNPKTYVVIGKNFGDEGKGRVVDELTSGEEGRGKCLVIRHNGGAQSGHTVVKKPAQASTTDEDSVGEMRFVFHELGAGSFNGADTLWADTFYPDLYKLNEEYAAFYAVSGIKSSIFSMSETPITIIDDVLLNMALEKSRGEGRHGSCGMGIYAAFLRTEAGFGITVADVKKGDEEGLYRLLKRIRTEYVMPRVRGLSAAFSRNGEYRDESGLENDYLDVDKCSEIMDLLTDDNVLRNAAREMYLAAEKVMMVGKSDDLQRLLGEYDRVIFETGQGLLLDSENKEYAPHVTGSRSGLTNPAEFSERFGLKIDEVIYVTRPYVTRHGAGLLKHECDRSALGITEPDSTNVTNEWQGDFRYAPHDSIADFLKAPCRDLKENLEKLSCNQNMRSGGRGQIKHKTRVSLAITHLSYTGDRMLFSSSEEAGSAPENAGAKDIRSIDIGEFLENSDIKNIFKGFYLYD